MKFKDIKSIAKTKGISAGNMKRPELIRAIQRAEGNFDCFGNAASGHCDQMSCLWREDCLATAVA
jgi:hypothetical protein